MTIWYNSTAIIIDDSYYSIAYSDGWSLGGTPQEYQQTTHGSKCSAGGCNFTFPFLGTAIEVLGTTSVGQNPVAQFQIDALPVSVYEQGAVSDTTYGNIFYSSPTLDAGQHTLTVTVTNADTLWVDDIIYTPSTPSDTSVPLDPSSSPSSSLSSPPPVPSPSPASSPSPSSPPAPSASPQPPQDPDPSSPPPSSAASPSLSSLLPSSSLFLTPSLSSVSTSPLTPFVPQSPTVPVPIPSVSPTSTPPTTDAVDSSNRSTASSLVGPIVGGVVGGVFVLVVLFAFVWWRRRKAKAGSTQPYARRLSRAPSPFLQRRSTYRAINKARIVTTSPRHSGHYSEAFIPDTPSFGIERQISRSSIRHTHRSNAPSAFNAATAGNPALENGESIGLVQNLSERRLSRQGSMSDHGTSRRMHHDNVGDVPPPYSGR